jgi:CHAT domain-containing protein
MINLGNADAIDGLVEDYKRLISGKFDDGNNKFQEAAHKLYELVFQPVEKYLLRAKKIFISPDGNLSLIPFEVLQGPDGRFLIEDYTFNYLSAGRDIVGFTNNQDAGNKCLLMGNPDFDLRSCDKQAVISKLDVQNTETSFGRRSVNFNEFSFKPLGYAEEELQAIAEIMGAEKTEIYRRGRVRTAACIYPGWSQKPCDEHVESAGQGNYGIDGSVL